MIWEKHVSRSLSNSFRRISYTCEFMGVWANPTPSKEIDTIFFSSNTSNGLSNLPQTWLYIIILSFLPEAQIYSQLSRLDKSSTSSRAALFLFGATVNSGQNKRSQIAVNMECARGIDEVWEDELGDKASSCVAEEDVSSFSIQPSLDLEPKTFLKMKFCSSNC